MAVYQIGDSQFEIDDSVQGAELQGVLEGLARQEAGTSQEPTLPRSQFRAENLREIGESPEFNEPSVRNFLGSLAANFITDPKELGQALTQQFEGSFVSEDPAGNVLINLPSGVYAINKPGLSGQDVAQFTSRAAAFTPAGRTVGPLLTRATQLRS